MLKSLWQPSGQFGHVRGRLWGGAYFEMLTSRHLGPVRSLSLCCNADAKDIFHRCLYTEILYRVPAQRLSQEISLTDLVSRDLAEILREDL